MARTMKNSARVWAGMPAQVSVTEESHSLYRRLSKEWVSRSINRACMKVRTWTMMINLKWASRSVLGIVNIGNGKNLRYDGMLKRRRCKKGCVLMESDIYGGNVMICVWRVTSVSFLKMRVAQKDILEKFGRKFIRPRIKLRTKQVQPNTRRGRA